MVNTPLTSARRALTSTLKGLGFKRTDMGGEVHFVHPTIGAVVVSKSGVMVEVLGYDGSLRCYARLDVALEWFQAASN